jgi:hypothetical protein
MVQRTIPEGLPRSGADDWSEFCRGVVERNREEGVTWIGSFVSSDRTRTFCLYDALTPEAIRRSAARNGLPVDEITRVTILDPYSDG